MTWQIAIGIPLATLATMLGLAALVWAENQRPPDNK